VKTGRPHRAARVRGGAHGNLPGGRAADGQGRNRGGGAAGLIKVGALRESLTLKCGLAYVTTPPDNFAIREVAKYVTEKITSARAVGYRNRDRLYRTWINELKSKMTFLKK